MDNLTKTIEALLFVSSKPLKVSYISKFLQVFEDEVNKSLEELKQLRKGTGIVLLQTDSTVQLATNPDLAETITRFLTQDLRENLTEAQLEVLTIIAYKKLISKAEIEAIRGVNSQYALRQLLMRGLVEKSASKTDQRAINYEVTTEFLQHLGINNLEELPNYTEFQSALTIQKTEQQ